MEGSPPTPRGRSLWRVRLAAARGWTGRAPGLAPHAAPQACTEQLSFRSGAVGGGHWRWGWRANRCIHGCSLLGARDAPGAMRCFQVPLRCGQCVRRHHLTGASGGGAWRRLSSTGWVTGPRPVAPRRDPQGVHWCRRPRSLCPLCFLASPGPALRGEFTQPAPPEDLGCPGVGGVRVCGHRVWGAAEPRLRPGAV